MENTEKLTAIIAGTGNLPIEACKSLKKQNIPFFVISLFPEENRKLKTFIGENDIIEKAFYKPSEVLNILKEKNSKRVLLIGKVDKTNLLKKIKFDWLAIKSLTSLFSKDDKSLMEKILTVFADNGIEVIHQSDVLGRLIVPPGILTGTLTENLKRDIKLGIDLALKISENNIGQTVIMKDGMILAVEAIEGTDICIQRGINLGKENIVICKGARLDQNTKYDLPTLGPSTLQKIQAGEVSVIAWQSTQTLIADQDKFIALAKEKEITLVSI